MLICAGRRFGTASPRRGMQTAPTTGPPVALAVFLVIMALTLLAAISVAGSSVMASAGAAPGADATTGGGAGTTLVAFAPSALGGERADSAAAMAHVRRLAADIGPRPAGTAREGAAAEYVAQCLSGYGYVVSRIPFSRTVAAGVCVSENVVAVAPWAKPGARTILIAASIDTPAPDSMGAVDNASGVAAMLECARIASGARGRHNLAFAAFGGTDMGRAGSKALVDGVGGGPLAAQDVIIAVILDSVGRPGPVSLIGWGGPRALAPSTLAGLVSAIRGSRAGGNDRLFDTTVGLLPEVKADHSPFLFAGVPAVAITTAQALPYPAPASLAPCWDTVDSVDPTSVVKAADAAIAAARWISSQARIPTPDRPYLAFGVFGAIVAVPYFAVLAVVAAAVALGLLSLAPARYALYSQLTRVRPGRWAAALVAALSVYAILAAVSWTSFLPSLVIGAVRGIERPWNAHPIPFAVAGTISALFFAMAAASLAGTGVRHELRLPLFRLSILLQAALVLFMFIATRIGAFFPALGLLFTVAALAAPDALPRALLTWLAPRPSAWLAVHAIQGIARRAFIDALEVPIVLCLLVAAVALPYVLALITLSPATGQGRGIAAGAGGAGGFDLARDYLPGLTVREYSRRGTRATPIRGRQQSPRTALMLALGFLSAILTGGLFLKPSYDAQSPQYVRAVQVGNGVIFRSEDNIRGVSVAVGPTAEPKVVDVGRSEFELPMGIAAPAVKLDVKTEKKPRTEPQAEAQTLPQAKPRTAPAAHAEELRVVMSLESMEPISWAAFELVGPDGIEVTSHDRGYEIEKARGRITIRTVLAGEPGPYTSSVELSVPNGTELLVRAIGGFRRNPSEILLAGTDKRFYQVNQFRTSTERITI